jgi:hypothetical protein
MEDLEKRVQQFRTFELPGQPPFAHMGTSYLINDLWRELTRLRAEVERLREALEKYGEHKAGCLSNHGLHPKECDCGFQLTLAPHAP